MRRQRATKTPAFFACGQGSTLGEVMRSLARGRISDGCACGTGESAMMAEDLADLRRWVMCGAIVVLAHGAIAAAMVTWRDEIEPAEPAAAIVIEFAPLPVAPAAPQTEIPPGPEQVMSDASPNEPVESLEEKEKVEEKVASKSVEEPPPKTKPPPNPDAAARPPPQELPTPQRQEPHPPAPTTSAPQALPNQTAAIPAAPTQGRITPTNSSVVPTWKTQIVALL